MDVDILVIILVALLRKGVNGMDLLDVFFQRRIQSLDARAHPMWGYEGRKDPTCVHPEDIGAEELENKIKDITPMHDNPRGTRLVPPFSEENPPNKVTFRIFCPSELHCYCLLYLFVNLFSACLYNIGQFYAGG